MVRWNVFGERTGSTAVCLMVSVQASAVTFADTSVRWKDTTNLSSLTTGFSARVPQAPKWHDLATQSYKVLETSLLLV